MSRSASGEVKTPDNKYIQMDYCWSNCVVGLMEGQGGITNYGIIPGVQYVALFTAGFD